MSDTKQIAKAAIALDVAIESFRAAVQAQRFELHFNDLACYTRIANKLQKLLPDLEMVRREGDV